ncbi:MAG: hypothetical protein VZR00_06485 [Lachnospiraceae bacterium]|jgi:hypothetical protein|nr:hypothetical protein [Lachnospiraceae bacterium]MEE3461524.1 hypothetical protein [Lachnospiraceae bacterium]
MGKIILCKGKLTDEPYTFERSGVKVYSIEEVCWYIGENIYLLDRKTFDFTFVNWVRRELDLSSLSEKLNSLLRDNADVRDLVIAICNACDYFDKNETDRLLKILDDYGSMSRVEKLKHRADSLMKIGQPGEALVNYSKIQSIMVTKGASDDEIADVSYSLALCCFMQWNFHASAGYFKDAYDKTNDFEALKGYLVSVQLGFEGPERLDMLDAINITEHEMDRFNEYWSEISDNAKYSRGFAMINGIRRAYKMGKLDEYYDRIHEMISILKDECRRSFE